MKERQTKQILIDFLQENTCLEVVDCGQWFYARYDCGEQRAKAMAFRADFDALPMEEADECKTLSYVSQNPGVSHKCGHDGHSAALVGLALELGGRKKEHLQM